MSEPDAAARAEESARRERSDPQAPSVRLARKTQSLDILYAVATSLSQPGGLEEVLGGFLDTLVELLDARAASVRLRTEDGHTRLIASRGLDPEVVERDRVMLVGQCPCGWVSSEGGLRVQSGTTLCRALVGRLMLDPDCAEFVVAPMQYQNRILGVYNLFLDRPLAAMGEDMPNLLVSVGQHLGLAVEKSRLESEARRLAVMEERNIIGAELHDSLAQSLIGMRLKLKMLGEALARKDVGAAQYEVKGLGRAMTRANADLRDLLTNYRLKVDDSGLAHRIGNLVDRFARETGIRVYFQNDCTSLALSRVQEIQVYYIIQEALANIRKHSGARNVRVMLNNEDDLYTVLIEDDGVGMVPGGDGGEGEHAGLAIMRERTERLPGQIVIESEPGEGTRIVLIFNAPPPEAPAAGKRG
ncbi:MAG TPA: ATP-binding protein [Usitatibacter sp.]|nr:ATP-binding protein [Usitatibacter sp.]